MATTESRIEAIDLEGLPADPRWRYSIVCQHMEGAPTARIDDWAAKCLAPRPDIGLAKLPGLGVAHSRNAALAACGSEALLFTDDDVSLDIAGLSSIIATFENDLSLALLAGQTVFNAAGSAKRYPAAPRRLTRFNSARIGTVELAVRPRLVRGADVGFDPAFGAGARYRLGDEYIFVTDCLKAGLRGMYEPVAIAVHRGASSGLDFATTAEERARVFERVFSPMLVPFVKLAFLLRHRRRFASLGEAWRFARAFLPFHPN